MPWIRYRPDVYRQGKDLRNGVESIIDVDSSQNPFSERDPVVFEDLLLGRRFPIALTI